MAIAILLTTGVCTGLLTAPAVFMLLAALSPADVEGKAMVMRLLLALALAVGLARPGLRVLLWDGSTASLGAQVAISSRSVQILHDLPDLIAPMVGCALLVIWAFERSRLMAPGRLARVPVGTF
jgi:hypothetical protein